MRAVLSYLQKTPGLVIIACIRMYQYTAPVRPAVCRYQPSCSEYAADAIRNRGVFAGMAFAIRRVLRCNPFSSGGYDMPPAKK